MCCKLTESFSDEWVKYFRYQINHPKYILNVKD